MTDLDLAQKLIAAGQPVFVARPAIGRDGQWDPSGGTDGCGYWLPPAWQKTKADLKVLERYYDGCAVGMVCGVVFDALDTDPRNEGTATRADLPAPKIYATFDTPSGGMHELVASLGVPGTKLPGVDIQAGAPDGQGRRFIFIEPTFKIAKDSNGAKTNQVVGYTVRETAGLDETIRLAEETGMTVADFVGQDRSGEPLRTLLGTRKPTGGPAFECIARDGVRPGYVRPGSSDPSNPFAKTPIDMRNQRTPREAGAMMRRAVERVENAPKGSVYDELNKAGLVLGHWVDELVTYDWACVRLDQALATNAVRNNYRGSGRRGYSWIRDRVTEGRAQPMWCIEADLPPWIEPNAPEPVDVTETPTGEYVAEDEADPEIRAEFPVTDWEHLWTLPEDEEWIVEGFIPARRATALYSAPKLGKSLLMLEMAVAVSRGKEFLGMATTETTVLYVDHENDLRGDIRKRLQSMGFCPADLKNLKYLPFPAMATLDSATGGDELLRAVKQHGIGLVIIDTVSRTIEGEENANDTWISWARHTGSRLKADGIAYIRLDHTGKDESKGMRGGSAKSSDPDAFWQLTGNKGTLHFDLTLDGGRMQFPSEKIGFARRTTPHLHSVRIATTTRASDGKFEADTAFKVNKTKRMVEMLYDEGPLAATQLTSRTAGNATKLKVIRDSLVLAGLVVVEKVGRSDDYRLSDAEYAKEKERRRAPDWHPTT